MPNSTGVKPSSGSMLTDPKARALLFQVLAVCVVVGIGWYLFHNTQTNLAQRGITSGFGFLNNTAGFGILQSLIEFTPTDTYARVFVIGLIVAALFTPLFSGAVQRSALGGIDQALGFLFGAARGVLLIAIAFIVYDRVLSDQRIEMVDNSRTALVFANFQAQIDDNIPSDAPGWIVERYNELTNVCATGTAPAPAAPAPEAPAAPATNP